MRNICKLLLTGTYTKYWVAGFLLTAGTASGVSANAIADQAAAKSHNFAVYLDKRKIGYHRVTIDQSDGQQQIHTVAKFNVRFMYIPVYSYRHETRETWQGDCLSSVTSSTNDNGRDYFIESQPIEGQRELYEIRLITQDGEAAIDGCIRTFAYWNVDLLKSSRLLNTQTGEYMATTINDLGMQMLDLGKMTVEAQQYRLVSDNMTIDLWYMDSHWLALESVTDSGAVLRYLPENPTEVGLLSSRS